MGCCCTATGLRGAIAKANTNRLKTASSAQRNAALTTWLLKPLQVDYGCEVELMQNASAPAKTSLIQKCEYDIEPQVA